MKKLIILLVIISLLSCKNEVEKSNDISNRLKDSTEIKFCKTAKVLKADTLTLEKLAALKTVDKVVITTLKKEISKNSIGKIFFKFDFYNKKKLVKSFSSSIEYGLVEGEWYSTDNVFDDIEKTDYRFVEISYGYPACGYTHTNFLFFIDNNNYQLVTKNESMADGGYGIWTEYDPIFENNQLISFSSKVIQVDSDESKPFDDDNEDLIISFYDSIYYKQQANKWIGELKTQKDKVYRKKAIKFDDYYKSVN